MKKDKIKLTFEVDRFKVVQMLAKNCETTEEYEEMTKIIESTDEVVREDASLEKTHCVLILDKLLRDNPEALLGIRLKKEEAEIETPGDDEDEEEAEEVAGGIELTGKEAKEFLDFIKSFIKKKNGGK